MTTNTGFALLLGAVVIETGVNDVIRLDEGGVITSKTLAAGIYYLRGDHAPDDYAIIVQNALNSGSANTYSISAAGSIDPASRCVTVTIARTVGATNFRVKWDDASATLTKASLGFVNTKAAANGTSEVSTKTPDCTWISNDAYRERRRVRDWSAGEVETEDGDTAVVRRGDKSRAMIIELRFVSGLRLLEEDTTAALDTDTLEHFIDVNGDGRPIEVHEAVVTAATTIIAQPVALFGFTDVGVFVLGVDAQHIEARRINPGVALYDIDLPMKGSTA